MPTYRELMDAAANADKAGDSAGAKRLVELAQQEQQAPVAEQPQTAPVQQPSPYTEAMTAAARAGGMGGLGMSAPILPEYGPDIVRYGGPMAAGLVTAPVSAPLAITYGVLSAAGSEFLAQAAEKQQGSREEFAPRQIGAAGAFGFATPVKFAPKIAPGVVNFLTNAGINIGASELGRYIEKGEYEVPTLAFKDVASRFGFPVAAAGLTSAVKIKASNLAETAAQRESISSGRFGGSVMASEILPKYTGLEAKVIADGNELAVKALNDLDAEIGPTLAKAYEGAKDSAEIAAQLTPHVNELTSLQQSARLARDEANRLEAQAAEAIASQRSDALNLKADAKEAAMKAAVENYVYNQGKERIFGGVSQKIGTIVSGASMQNLRGVAKAAKESTEAGLDRIWSNAGVGLNDTIVSVKDIVESATRASAKGLGLEDQLVKTEFIETLGKALGKVDPDQTGKISLAGFRQLRDKFVQELTAKTGDANYANRVASTSYDVIKDAANSYVEKNLPGQAEKWKFANAASAAIYKAKKSNVIDLISEGNMDGVLSLMKKEGMAKPILAEIDAYAASIAGTQTRGAKYAAVRFKQDTIDAMRDTLVEDSLHFGKGQDSSAKIVDFPKLISTLDELRQRKFPVELLDLGTPDDIRKLARVASAGGEGGMTSDQFSKYIDNRKNFGAGAAAARTSYDKAYKDFLISNDVKTRANAAARMTKEAKAAGFKAGEIEAAQIAAQSDPIIALLSDTKMGLSKDPAQNGKWIASLFSMSPSTVGQFVDKLKQSGRGVLLEDIKKSAMADVMRDTFSKTQDVVNKKTNVKNLLNFFEGENGKQRSQILETLMGADEYSNFKKNFSEPIKKIVQTRESLSGKYPSPDDFVRPAISAKGLATGTPTGATLFKTAYDNVKKLVDEQRYNLVYTLYVNPSTANAYAKSMYDMDKFISSSAANSMAIRLAMQQDADVKSNLSAPQQR